MTTTEILNTANVYGKNKDAAGFGDERLPAMISNKHTGSSLGDLLKEDGIHQDAQNTAAERTLDWKGDHLREARRSIATAQSAGMASRFLAIAPVSEVEALI
jgi:hypothetical protein